MLKMRKNEQRLKKHVDDLCAKLSEMKTKLEESRDEARQLQTDKGLSRLKFRVNQFQQISTNLNWIQCAAKKYALRGSYGAPSRAWRKSNSNATKLSYTASKCDVNC